MSHSLYFRRCHICGFTNQSSDEAVCSCHCCGRVLIPFFYFDERFVPTLDESRARSTNHADISGGVKNVESHVESHGGYGPIQGLTAYWNEV